MLSPAALRGPQHSAGLVPARQAGAGNTSRTSVGAEAAPPDSCECAITGALVKHRCPCDYALQLSGSGLNGSGLRTVLGPPTRLPLARLVPASERAGCSTGGPVRVKFEAAGEKGEVHEDRRRR